MKLFLFSYHSIFDCIDTSVLSHQIYILGWQYVTAYHLLLGWDLPSPLMANFHSRISLCVSLHLGVNQLIRQPMILVLDQGVDKRSKSLVTDSAVIL